jgi:4-amino-4-deoxy-L-arabinose transferase-like glycosyltransferase
MDSQTLLLTMTAFQIVWFTTIGLTGASSNWPLLLSLIICSALFGLLLAFPRDFFLRRLNKLDLVLERESARSLAVFCGLFLIVGLFYAYHQRIWTFDEEHCFAVSKMIAEMGPGTFFHDYSELPWLSQRHPPLIPLLNGLALAIFGPHLTVIRIISLLFALGAIVVTFLIGNTLYDGEIGLRAALLLASFPLLMRLGTAGMTDVQVTFFAALAVYLLIRLQAKPTYSLAASKGVVLGLGLLSKYTLLLIYPVLLSHALLEHSLRRVYRYLFVSGLVSVVIFATWLVFAYFEGVLGHQMTVVARDSGRWLPQFTLESLLTRLPSAVGLYSFPLFFLGGLEFWRHKRSGDQLILLWIVIVSCILLMTVPDHRYFMLVFPALAIFAARGLNQASGLASRVITLSLLFWGLALILFVHWSREAHVFS